MNFLGDFFAIGLVIILLMFYADGRARPRYMSADSRIFLRCLIFTALTASIDIAANFLLEEPDTPLWLNMVLNSLYFVINIITTSTIAQFLFHKILAHAYDDHCMHKARCGLAILFVAYMALVVVNIWTGWLFSFDENGAYCRGPLNAVGYGITICQMGLVLMCYVRNRKIASRPMRRALLQTFPVVVLCIAIQRMFPSIMLNGFIMAMMDTVLFLTFQSPRQGVHTLTKLNDRLRFFREAERRMERKEPFRTYLINIKNFSAINRKHGHIFGDEFLYQFAFALERMFSDALAFHMNGTVFALIMPARFVADEEKRTGELLDFLDKGLDCMKKHVEIDYVLVEYAVNEAATNAAEFYEKLEYAAARAYEAQQRYIRYTEDLGVQMRRERYLMERLNTVDKEHGYEVWLQPIQCLKSGAFCSMEALIRLREPDGSLISPAEFIPLAEESGHIAPITWFVLEEVCRILKQDWALDDVSVSVNVPMAQLLDKGFMTRLNSIVDRAGIAHRRICLEFTERAILDTFEQTKEVMERLTANGYRFFLDDFGAGYSNFNCLLQLPFQVIKLDACLVRDSRGKTRDLSIVGMLTTLMHDLGLQVVAEGVETMAEVERLRECGVDRIQGYALAKPMPEDQLLSFYRKKN